MTRISVGVSARSLGLKVAIDDGPTSSAGIGGLLAVQVRETEDLLDDVADVDGRRGRSACLHLGAQCAQVIRVDLGEELVAERRHDVPVDDAFAHRAGAVGHARFRQPLDGKFLEGLRLGQAALLALLLLARGAPLGNGALGVHAAGTRPGERDPVRPIAADRERLPAAV